MYYYYYWLVSVGLLTPLSPCVQMKSKENEISELKSRFLRHRQILMANYQDAEAEIKRMDEIHHESVSRVLQVSHFLGVVFFLLLFSVMAYA